MEPLSFFLTWAAHKYDQLQQETECVGGRIVKISTAEEELFEKFVNEKMQEAMIHAWNEFLQEEQAKQLSQYEPPEQDIWPDDLELGDEEPKRDYGIDI